MELSFTPTELETLKKLQYHTSDRSTYQKLTTLIMLHNNFSQELAAEILGVDRSTINRHYNSYKVSKDFNSYIATHYKPCLGLLSEEQLAAVSTYVVDNLCKESLQVKGFIEQTYGIKYSISGVIALLHRLDFVYKKTKLVPSKADIAKQEAFVETFRALETSLPQDEVILFADGVHPQHNTEASYAWIAKGKEKEILSNTGRTRVNINGAINPHNPTEVVAYECETIDAITSIEFLKQVEKRYEHKTCIHLFVDNARYNHSKLVQAYIETSKITMHFLPAYSPNLNPIERLWKLMKKEIIKSNYIEKVADFKEKIKLFFENIETYEEKLKTLINTKFHIGKQSIALLQTSVG
jgi:transposase